MKVAAVCERGSTFYRSLWLG